MSYALGENGYIGINGGEKTWGLSFTSAPLQIIKTLSSDISVKKESRSSEALEGGRGSRSRVFTATNRDGSTSIEYTPNAGIGFLFNSALGSGNDAGTVVAAGNSTTLDGDTAKGDTTFDVNAIGTIVDTMELQIGTGSTQECVKVSGAPAGTTVTLTSALRFAHLSTEAVVEVEAPYVHTYIRTDDVELPSLAITKGLQEFGTKFKGSRIDTLSFTCGQNENATGDFSVVAKSHTDLLKADLLTVAQLDTLVSDLEPFIFENGCVKESSVELANVKSFNWDIANNHDPRKYYCGGGELGSLIAQRAVINVGLDVDWEDNAYQAALEAGTELDLEVNFSHDAEIGSTGSNYHLTFYIPRFILNESPHNLEAGILSTQPVGNAYIDSVAGYDLKVELTDGTYTYPEL